MRGLGHARRGSIAIETAAVLCFAMVPLLALGLDAGRALLLQYKVTRALHAGLIYAWGVPGAPVADVVEAAQGGYGSDVSALAATASYGGWCIPPAGSRLVGALLGTGSVCPVGQVLGTWLTASTSTAFTPVFSFAWGGGVWTLSATATVRVK